MGLRSSYPAMIRRLLAPGETGPAATGYELDELVLDAAHRVRRIGRVLEGVGDDVREVLSACFTLPVPRKLKSFGIGAAIVPGLRVTQDAYRAAGVARPLEDWLARLPRVAGRSPDLGRASARIVFAAAETYVVGWRSFVSPVRPRAPQC
jgi:hypothetical protein